ncbi:hypothetical protein EJ08DRAFT_586368 [Tothia fuscella]|uniref:non-specific serine/threonine protein kinase n=1 Tax=Tothia fuscella TaxID=1048955 RepID=A0A9P4NTR5_9PEZI|nr:hypothetical protein EJ08DRAFT_586368 [Tothia fuscella]
MASAPFHNPISAVLPAAYHAPSAISAAPPGTFAPGTKVQVGQHRVIIDKYLSEGGFAHVYLVRVPRSDNKYDAAVLKRVAVPDKDRLANMRTEVETMKKLKGHRKIVTYIDSHASQLKGGGYEVFLLMEYCAGGGLIDFMNTRLQHRLTEPEILKIFSDVAEGVACMHYLKPPLLHRDLKVENVLISTSGSSRIYKLCDFGSTARPIPAAKNAAEGRLIEDDIQRHTTLQYRSPEMIDVYRKQPIDEKSDVWALGVLLYKLCYYTTPFEDVGQMAILNATFKFPSYPSFSDRTKKLISSMLRENPTLRPNIYQVVKEVCSIRNTECPIKDIYANRTQSESRRYDQLPPSEANVASPPMVGIQKVEPLQIAQPALPDITPMRRGRPTQAQSHLQPVSAKATPAGSRGTSSDPFAALNSSSAAVRSAAVDELSARYPALDEFSLLHDRGAKFEFGQTVPPVDAKQETISKRVTAALADEVFSSSTPASKPSPVIASTASLERTLPTREVNRTELPPPARSQPSLAQPIPQKPYMMVSTGIQTSPPPSPSPPRQSRWRGRHPKHSNTHIPISPQPQQPPSPFEAELPPRPEKSTSRPSILERHRTKSQSNTLAVPQSPASSRPSLESQRPAALDLSESISRSKSANARPRPASVYVESNIDYLRDRETPLTKAATPSKTGGWLPKANILGKSSPAVLDDSSSDEEGPEPIASNVSFLREMETDNTQQKKSRRSSSGGKSKRTSLPSISLSGTKHKLSGRFGDAFRRFETNSSSQPAREPSPDIDHDMLRNSTLTPIAGSERTGTSGRSDDDMGLDETQDLSPEVRRELERRRLSQEEKRVADAAAEYRQRLAQGDKGGVGPSKGSAIQDRVKSLLDGQKEAPPTRTAEGYGRFTPVTKPGERPVVARKPVAISSPTNTGFDKTRPMAHPSVASLTGMVAGTPPSSAPAAVNRTGPRPNIAPKPKAFRTGGGSESTPARTPQEEEDWEPNFSKKYPALGLDMVEAEIRPSMRVKDV